MAGSEKGKGQVIKVSSYLQALCRDYKRVDSEATKAMKKIRKIDEKSIEEIDYLRKKKLQNEWAEKDIELENLARKIASCLVNGLDL